MKPYLNPDLEAPEDQGGNIQGKDYPLKAGQSDPGSAGVLVGLSASVTVNSRQDASGGIPLRSTRKASRLKWIPQGKHPSPAKPAADESRRAFLNQSWLYLAGLAGLVEWFKAQAVPSAVVKRQPVTPPGSQSITHFTHTCTACHLCVSACPTQVLQPAWLEYGWSGILQPRMDYQLSFCNFECTLCGQVCPTGAILPLSKAAKQTTQLGIAQFLQERCIVYTDHTACGACAEHCPTKAVQMVPYQENLTIPAVREKICIGCGACEYACPVRPQRAIYVSGHGVHRVAQPPEAKPLKVDIGRDFPF
jgi:ferredoxin